MIDDIKSPQDVKKMGQKELRELCGEIRKKIIDTVSENGGHLASNLGIVETTVAIHKVFDAPRDTLIFDVGHQAYAHKLLTGRYPDFGTLRKTGGISGFVNSSESEYDPFTEGHSGTSISQALGVSAAKDLQGDDSYVVALVGDGSFTNGMIYEALNNCTALGRRLIIILNDNEMSISKNTGGAFRPSDEDTHEPQILQRQASRQEFFHEDTVARKTPCIRYAACEGFYKKNVPVIQSL